MQNESFFAFIFSLLLKLLQLVDIISEKLLVHEFNYAVFFMSIVLMPAWLYAIKTIPLRYTVYSKDTIFKLDSYEF